MKLFGWFILLLSTGCSIGLTQDGNKVQVVSQKERDAACELIGIVTGSVSIGTTGHDARNAMNEARNKAAAQGANAIRVVNVDSYYGSSTVTAEALRCKFGSP